MITAVILTMNEEKNIEKCILSINKFVDEIIIVDSGSSDNTIEIAKKYTNMIFFNKFIDYATQFNWALDNISIKNDWILRIDADERLNMELGNEITENIANCKDSITGFVLKQKIIFMGKWIKHGGAYPFKKLMVFRKGIGRIEQKRMDEHTVLSMGTSIELRHPGEHYDFKDLTHWISKHNWYATREMQDYFSKQSNTTINKKNSKMISRKRERKSLYYKFPLFTRSYLLFLFRYFIKLGFLDGKEGLIFHYMQAYWYRFLVDAKIYEQNLKGYIYEETGALRNE